MTRTPKMWVVGLEMARVMAGRARDLSGTETPEEFADYRGIELRDVPLDGTRAQLVVGPSGDAHILLPDHLTDPAERRWSIAHELGHFELKHPAPPAAELCEPRPARRGPRCDRDDEDEADEWAMTYTMPDSEVAALCDRRPMTLDVAAELARRCCVPLAAAAARVTSMTMRICAAVLSRQGMIEWVSPSMLFLGWARGMMRGEGDEIGPGALARKFFDTGELPPAPQLVPAAAWFHGLDDHAWIHEHSMETEPGGILTMLWMSADMHFPTPRDARVVPRITSFMRNVLLSDPEFLEQIMTEVTPRRPSSGAPTWLAQILCLDQPSHIAHPRIAEHGKLGADPLPLPIRPRRGGIAKRVRAASYRRCVLVVPTTACDPRGECSDLSRPIQRWRRTRSG